MYLKCSTAALLLGFLIDLLLGDPFGRFHPICAIGNLIAATEKAIRKQKKSTPRKEFWGGVLLVFVVVVLSGAVPFVLVFAAYRIHWICGLILETVLCYFIFAVKSLKTESKKVATALEQEGIEAGRKAVSMIVGRDTESLSETGVIKAAVETVAENTSDGVIAPMLYMAIGGPVLGFFYKAINTMDSMVGYKNETYLYFGRCAAKLDDVANYLPARIAAGCMILASCLLPGCSGRDSARIYRRDKRNHASPNSAQTEAVMAGALGVQLAGDAWYFGVKHEKPTIGDDKRPVEIADIGRSHRLLYGTSLLALAACLLVRVGLIALF